ncbi:MAG: efflux RND transporter periplasmic adaptor subunit [Patescibacteria group bacterium]|nr:efflux RND transporter periplasmic adaptor subunit [Patescibacteria group bacterium]MDE1965799.1 efflux RND transporter periplasmic adaptor subunit [Patescibacteria group bacterium]
MPKRLIASLAAHPVTSVVSVAAVALAITGGIALHTLVRPTVTAVRVALGPLTEVVSADGVVRASEAADLSLQTSGRVTAIPASVGEHVYAGQTLLLTDDASAAAALASAKAALAVQEAKLASLETGTRPEQLALDRTAVTDDQAALRDAIRSAYVYADDAVHVRADALFTNPRTNAPTLAFTVSDSVLANTIQTDRVTIESTLAKLAALVNAPSFATDDPRSTAFAASASLSSVVSFLDELAKALTAAPTGATLSSAALAADQASINTGRLNVSAALTALTSATTALSNAEGTLTLASSGATAEDLAAQKAQVDVAAAAVDSAQAELDKTALAAPFAGTVSRQDAQVGDTLSPGQSVISVVSDAHYRMDAYVSEADIGKIAVGDAASVTLAAYPDSAPLPATVSAVAPAAEQVGGILAYKVTAVLTDNDPRVKAGLSGSLSVTTKHLDSVLQVPASAVIRNGTDHFVMRVLANGSALQVPVTVGATGSNGNTAILSGLSENDSVETFGSAK